MDFFSRPMTSGPDDYPVGQDELGNIVYATPMGDTYTLKTQQAPRGSVVKGLFGAAADDPKGFAKDLLMGAAEGVWQGVSAPGRAAAGEPVTYGDVAATAMDWALPQVPGLGAKYDPAQVNMGARSPAQQQSQEILDLLSAGRASDVTDDMMAGADAAYLFENYDLPMDEASRMARARDMGFDVDIDLYHGSLTPYDAPRPMSDVRNSYEDAGTYNSDSFHGPGYYTTTSPRDASMNYARPEGPDVDIKIENRFERLQNMDFDELADEIRLGVSPEDIEAINPAVAAELRRVNALSQSNLTTGDVEAFESALGDLDAIALEDITRMTARRMVGPTDGVVYPLYGRAKNPVITKGGQDRKPTFFELQTEPMDPKDFLDEAGGDMDLATDLALDASFEQEPVGPLVDFANAIHSRMSDVGMSWEDADGLRANILEDSWDYGGKTAADLEYRLRNDPHLYDAVGYETGPGDLLSYGYRAAGHDAIDLHSPGTTFSNMGNLGDASFHRVFLEPNAVRSKFARFDPRLAHLRNLLAGAAGLAPLGLLGSQQDEEQAIRNYLAGT